MTWVVGSIFFPSLFSSVRKLFYLLSRLFCDCSCFLFCFFFSLHRKVLLQKSKDEKYQTWACCFSTSKCVALTWFMIHWMRYVIIVVFPSLKPYHSIAMCWLYKIFINFMWLLIPWLKMIIWESWEELLLATDVSTTCVCGSHLQIVSIWGECVLVILLLQRFPSTFDSGKRTHRMVDTL